MCPVMIRTIYFEADHKKLVSSQKSSIFGPQKGHFGQSGPRNGFQSYLRIWGTYELLGQLKTQLSKIDPKTFSLTENSFLGAGNAKYRK